MLVVVFLFRYVGSNMYFCFFFGFFLKIKFFLNLISKEYYEINLMCFLIFCKIDFMCFENIIEGYL